MDRAIIFDVDGTLAETEEAHRKAFNRSFTAAGLDWHWDQELYRKLLTVTGGKERIRYFIEDFGGQGAPADRPDAFIKRLHATKTEAYVNIVAGGELDLRPGVRKLIHTAREEGYRLGISTTTTPANIDALFSATLGAAGHDLFEVICAGDSVPNKKPAPDVYLLALERLSLPGASCIAVEDSRNGLLSARAAGISTIVTPGLYTLGENFEEAALVVDDLEHLDFAKIESLFG